MVINRIQFNHESRRSLERFSGLLLLAIAGVIVAGCARVTGIELRADPTIIKRHDSTTVYWAAGENVTHEELAVMVGEYTQLLNSRRKYAPMADTTFTAELVDEVDPFMLEMLDQMSVDVKVTDPIVYSSEEERRLLESLGTMHNVYDILDFIHKHQSSRAADAARCKMWKIQYLNAWMAGEGAFREFAENNPDNAFADDARRILAEGRYDPKSAYRVESEYREEPDYRAERGYHLGGDYRYDWERGESRGYERWEVDSRTGDVALNLRGAECDDDGIGTLYFDIRDDRTDRFVQPVYQHGFELLENGRSVEIISLDRISRGVNAPVDFVFVLDGTGSMQPYITALKNDIHFFAGNLAHSGIDYRLGLVVFGDEVRSSRGMTSDVYDFSNWVSDVYAHGGDDPNENALEAMAAALDLPLRQNAYRNIVVITDAGFHDARNDASMGRTRFTADGMVNLLNRENVALSVVGPAGHTGQMFEGKTQLDYKSILESCLEGRGIDIGTLILSAGSASSTPYSAMAQGTGGYFFPIPFSGDRVDLREIFSQYHAHMTQHLYRLRYRRSSAWSYSSVDLLLRLRTTYPEVFAQDTWHCKRNVEFSNIYFPIGKYGLDDILNPQDLKEIAYTLRSNPDMSISLEGYTCDINTPEYNFDLSWRRLSTVAHYLKSFCHPSQVRISTGFGEHKYVQELNPHVGGRRSDLVNDWSRRMNRCVRVGLIENQYDPDAYPQIDRPRGMFRYTIKLLNPRHVYDQRGLRIHYNEFRKLESTYAGRQFFDGGLPCFGGFYREADAYAFMRNVLQGLYGGEFAHSQFIVTRMLP